jgi:hypothetical protein
LVTALAISACAGGPVTNARICSEIPFIDGPEGACVWTVSRKTELIGSKEWVEKRPKMLMIDAQSWTEIKKDWLKACRMAGPDCNVSVDSVDKTIKALDSIAGAVLNP